MRIVVATIKSWNIEKAERLIDLLDSDVKVITSKEQLTRTELNQINPDYVFFPHWSYMIPEEVYANFNCVVFHMTDLPFGRGGSPLQNLIVRGIEETKISAIKVVGELDAGPIYLKENLALEGSATEIFNRATDIIFEKMIPQIVKNHIEPVEQEGEPVYFKRRKPSDSEINADFSMKQIYDYIRMLDAEGYPNAFINYGDYRLEFSDGRMKDNELEAKVVIRRKE